MAIWLAIERIFARSKRGRDERQRSLLQGSARTVNRAVKWNVLSCASAAKHNRFAPPSPRLANPPSARQAGRIALVTLQLKACDAFGNVFTPSADQPITANVYGAPAGVITLVYNFDHLGQYGDPQL